MNEAQFWKQRYDTQHRTVHRLEDEIARLRAALTRLKNPRHLPASEEAALLQAEVEKIAAEALAADARPPSGA